MSYGFCPLHIIVYIVYVYRCFLRLLETLWLRLLLHVQWVSIGHVCIVSLVQLAKLLTCETPVTISDLSN